MVGAIREQASTLRERVSETVASVAEEQKTRAAEGVHDAADATREAARQLQGNNHSWIAGVVESAADTLNDFSETLRKSEFRSLYEGVEQFAREQPVLFAAGAFAVGMLLARTTRLGMEGGIASSGTGSASGATATYGESSHAGPRSYTEACREC